MTNKIRSVIEDARCRLIASQQYEETDYIHIVDVHNHVYKTSVELLDAIIEDMEEELLSMQYKLNTYKNDSKEYAFLYACKTNQEMNLSRLKQAREELSTYTTQ